MGARCSQARGYRPISACCNDGGSNPTSAIKSAGQTCVHGAFRRLDVGPWSPISAGSAGIRFKEFLFAIPRVWEGQVLDRCPRCEALLRLLGASASAHDGVALTTCRRVNGYWLSVIAFTMMSDL
jgi:hypothetical protein